MILIFMSSIASASATEDNLTHIASDLDDCLDEASPIHVNANADGQGNGSEQSPYSSLNQAIHSSLNDSTIILEEGTY